MTGGAGKRCPSRNPAGRPRSQEVDRAILEAALRLSRTTGYASVTIDMIAAEAGVGKPSIYRRWRSKAEIVTEAVARQAEEDIPVRDTGALSRDLHDAVLGVAKQLRTKDDRIVRSLFAEAQLDDTYRPLFQTFILRRRRAVRTLVASAVKRGEIRQGLDIDLIVDEIYGPLLYRILVGHLEIDDRFVHRHVAHLLASLAKERS